MNDLSGTAWSDPATRAMFRRWLRPVWVLFGVVLLTIFLAGLNGIARSSRADELDAHGVKTTGVVIHLASAPCGRDAPPSVQALIRFSVGGSPQLHTFNTTCSDGLFVGAVVPIAYKRHDPATFSVNHQLPQNESVSSLLVIDGAIGFTCAIVGCALFVSRIRSKSVLKQTGWVRTTCDFRSVPRGLGRYSVEIWINGSPSAFTGSDLFKRAIRQEGIQDMLIAGNSPKARAIRQPEGKKLLMLRRAPNAAPRSQLDRLARQR